MKTPKTNSSKSLYLNILMLPTWYPISISLIPPSPVYSLCSNHTIILVPYLYILPMRIPFYYFHLTPAFAHLMGFLFKLSDFLLISIS